MHYLAEDSGIEWHYDLEGEGDVLLFIHGWGVDRRIWRQQLKHFKNNYKVLTVDLPGHGKTSFKKVSLDVMALDIHQLLESLGIRELSIIGSSLGGMVALKIYHMGKEVIDKLIFVGSTPKFARSDDFPHGLNLEKMKKLGDQLETNYPEIVSVFFRSLFTHQERETRRFKWIQKFRRTEPTPMKIALTEYLDILEHVDLRYIFKEVKAPIQFINGTHDEICNREIVNDLRELCPKARFDDFENCGHFPFLTKSYEFNAILDDFLKKGK